ncbi:MAG: hypothetical protein WCH11_02710 [Bdellovibrio sp.]
MENVQGYFTNLKLIIILTAVSLFSVSGYSALKCSDVFNEKSIEDSFPKELPDVAKVFWNDIGTELSKNLDHDFQRSANKKIYAEQIKMNHPEVEFYKSLGFVVTADGTFKSPTIKTLFSRLNRQISRLNRQLKEAGADFQINPKVFLDLKNEEFGQQQRVVLDPLQSFWAPGYRLIENSNILKTLPFYKFVGGGGFPIGGIASASGLSRTMVEVEKTTIDPQQKAKLNAAPNISDFLHDLGHLSAFLRKPEFAAAYVRVFRSQYFKIQKMNPEEQKAYLGDLERSGTDLWRRNFYFSESAWLVQDNYQTKLAKYPIVSSILKTGKSFNSEEIVTQIRQIDRKGLLRELEILKADWWALFDPMGGAVNDMISLDAFSPEIRSNFIVQRVLRELEDYLKADQPFENPHQNSLSIIFGFLRNSPRMTTKSWEYFARTDDWKNSEVFKAMQDMFPAGEVGRMPEWKKLFDFLYKP